MKNITLALAFLVVQFALLATPAGAQEIRAGDLVITQPWSRATPAGAKVAGGYLTIENKGSAPDRLVSGTGDVAGRVEIHEMAMNNGVMTMRPLDKGIREGRQGDAVARRAGRRRAGAHGSLRRAHDEEVAGHSRREVRGQSADPRTSLVERGPSRLEVEASLQAWRNFSQDPLS
jgi:hypothetical protein